MKHILMLAPLAVIAACTDPALQTPTAPPVPVAGADTCNAGRHVNLVGQDATALERVLIMGPVRVIRPGQPVTMDFRPDRINFNIGTDNRIVSVSCN